MPIAILKLSYFVCNTYQTFAVSTVRWFSMDIKFLCCAEEPILSCLGYKTKLANVFLQIRQINWMDWSVDICVYNYNEWSVEKWWHIGPIGWKCRWLKIFRQLYVYILSSFVLRRFEKLNCCSRQRTVVVHCNTLHRITMQARPN